MKTKIPLYKRPWRKLSARQKSVRTRSLSVLNELRKSKSKSVQDVARENQIKVSTVMNNTNGLKKVNGKLIVKKWDVVPRVLLINKEGQEKSIEVKDSRTAGLIGRYHNAIRKFLNTGDRSKLKRFRNKKVKDSGGKIHRLETDAEKIIQINQRIEENEFFEVYAQ